jgi:hypothetical protein
MQVQALHHEAWALVSSTSGTERVVSIAVRPSTNYSIYVCTVRQYDRDEPSDRFSRRMNNGTTIVPHCSDILNVTTTTVAVDGFAKRYGINVSQASSDDSDTTHNINLKRMDHRERQRRRQLQTNETKATLEERHGDNRVCDPRCSMRYGMCKEGVCECLLGFQGDYCNVPVLPSIDLNRTRERTSPIVIFVDVTHVHDTPAHVKSTATDSNQSSTLPLNTPATAELNPYAPFNIYAVRSLGQALSLLQNVSRQFQNDDTSPQDHDQHHYIVFFPGTYSGPENCHVNIDETWRSSESSSSHLTIAGFVWHGERPMIDCHPEAHADEMQTLILNPLIHTQETNHTWHISGPATTLDRGHQFHANQRHMNRTVDLVIVSLKLRQITLFVSAGAHVHLMNLTLREGSHDQGGCLHIRGASHVKMHNVLLHACVADQGGGLFLTEHSTVKGAAVNVVENHAMTDGGGLFLDAFTTWDVAQTRVEGNLARYGKGGGVLLVGGGHDFLLETLVVNNTAVDGGGIYWRWHHHQDDADVNRNTSTNHMSNWTGMHVLNNRASDRGGGGFFDTLPRHWSLVASYWEKNQATLAGGGLFLFETDGHLEYSLIDANQAGTKPSIYVE